MFKSLPSAVRLALSALVVVALSLSARAQTGTTSLHGTVIDQSHSAIVGANVTLLDVQKGQLRTATTGSQGEYGFESLTPGTYTLTVEMPSFRKYERRNLQLLVNQPETANVTLEVGSASQVVEVNAQTATLNTSDASLGNAFGENQVKALPMEGRNVPDLLTLQPGVAYLGNRTDVDRTVDTRSGAVNGARSDQSNLTLDGVDVNDQVNGNAFTSVLPVSLDSVQEFRVTTTNANADQGGSSGAQVSLVTKSGTNSFHGSLYEYNRNTFTSANDYFVKLSQLQNGEPNTPPKLIRNIFGGSLGGPILKDRLFFFVNYEAARQREEASVIRLVPSDSLRAGIIRYFCDTTDPSCAPGNPNVNVVNTSLGPVASLSQAQIKGMDPLGIGVNQTMLSYFNSFPVANDLSQGDTLNFVGYPVQRRHSHQQELVHRPRRLQDHQERQPHFVLARCLAERHQRHRALPARYRARRYPEGLQQRLRCWLHRRAQAHSDQQLSLRLYSPEFRRHRKQRHHAGHSIPRIE